MIDPLICKNCFHSKESHRYGYLECSYRDYKVELEYLIRDGIRYYRTVPKLQRTIMDCNCKEFKPFENICGNKITWYVDKDISKNEVVIW